MTLLPQPFPAHSSSKPAEGAAEAALTAAPKFSAAEAAIGMAEVRPADPPEKPERAETHRHGQKNTEPFELMP